MESKYTLRYLPLFEKDLDEITDYITNTLHNLKAAYDLIDDLEKAILDRLTCPEAFECYHSCKERKYIYYRIYVKNYTIYYVIINNKNSNTKIMEIRRLLYNRRNLNKIV